MIPLTQFGVRSRNTDIRELEARAMAMLQALDNDLLALQAEVAELKARTWWSMFLDLFRRRK